MVVCKFFLEGRCKFGENCRNEHYIPQDRRNQRYDDRNTGYQQQRYSNQQQPQRQQYIQQPRLFSQNHAFGGQSSQFSTQHSQQGVRTQDGGESLIRNHLNVVREDAISWENSGQWPFTCYAPLLHRLLNTSTVKDGGSLPGLKDYSPEEIRWQMYQLKEQETISQFLTKLQQAAADYQAKRLALQNMDQATANFIVRYEVGGMANPMGTVFASAPILLEPILTATQSSTMQSGFSFSLPGSGTASGSSTGQPGMAQNSFQFALPGAPPGASVAASSPSFSFKLPGTQTQTPSLFQNPTSPANPPMFGFGASQIQQPQQSVFGSTQTQQSAFGASQSQPTSFGSSQTPSIFSGGQSQPSFRSQVVSESSSKSGTELFSSMNDLEKEELEQFNSQKFCMGKIPMHPPPRELCM